MRVEKKINKKEDNVYHLLYLEIDNNMMCAVSSTKPSLLCEKEKGNKSILYI